MKTIKTTTLNLLFLTFLTFLSGTVLSATDTKAQEQGASTLTLSGEELFIQNRCVRCHTIGRGRFVGPDLAQINDRYSKEEIVKWIENPQQIYQSSGKMPFNEGYPPMPPLNIPPVQAKAIAEYLVSFNAPEDGATSGSISGQVINKTNDGPAPGIELTLTSYMGDKPTGDKTLKSDEQGNFSFDGLNWDRSYAITVNFKGAQYSTDKMVFYPNEETKIINLPIYDPTVDEDTIKITEAQMIVQVEEGTLSVADLTLYNNTGDKIYIGGNELEDGRRESLKMSTPKQAQSLNFIHGITPDDVVKTEYGFADTTSVPPGQKRVVYAYNLPLNSGTTSFEKTIDYPTESFLLLVSESTKSVEVRGLNGGEAVQIHEESFLKWTGEDLKPGHSIKVELNSPLAQGDYLKWGALGFLLLIIIAGVIYSTVLKKSTEQDIGTDQDKGVGDIEAKHLALIKEIAALDDSFEAGNIEEQKYKNIRGNKIEELKKLKRRL
jgi:cytochrome c551/c552